jgi:predicted ester cyclase
MRTTTLGGLGAAALLLALLAAIPFRGAAQSGDDPAANKALVQRYVEEFWNQGNEAIADELIAPDATFRTPGPPDQQPAIGPESRKSLRAETLSYLSDVRLEILDQIAEGDRVVTHYVLIGTFAAPLRGLPPTGEQVALEGVQIDRIADGRIVDQFEIVDDLGFMIQLGALRPPFFPGTPEAGATPAS